MIQTSLYSTYRGPKHIFGILTCISDTMQRPPLIPQSSLNKAHPNEQYVRIIQHQLWKGEIGFTVPKMDTVPNFMPRTVSDCKLSNTVNTKVVNFAAAVVKLMGLGLRRNRKWYLLRSSSGRLASTVWKFHNFSVNQILRKIKVREFKMLWAKSDFT